MEHWKLSYDQQMQKALLILFTIYPLQGLGANNDKTVMMIECGIWMFEAATSKFQFLEKKKSCVIGTLFGIWKKWRWFWHVLDIKVWTRLTDSFRNHVMELSRLELLKNIEKQGCWNKNVKEFIESKQKSLMIAHTI